MNRYALSGAISLGLSTMVQPAASAGATLQAIWLIGQFQGVIKAQTPTGSRDRRRPSRSSRKGIPVEQLHRGLHVADTKVGLRLAGKAQRRTHLIRDGGRHILESRLVDRQESREQGFAISQ